MLTDTVEQLEGFAIKNIKEEHGSLLLHLANLEGDELFVEFDVTIGSDDVRTTIHTREDIESAPQKRAEATKSLYEEKPHYFKRMTLDEAIRFIEVGQRKIEDWFREATG
jgi:hypothetical protein